MYGNFPVTPSRASCETAEDFVLPCFQVSFYVEDSCTYLYNDQSNIFDYSFVILTDDYFPSIKNTALTSSEIPIYDLHFPL